jgi:hypothetical protein
LDAISTLQYCANTAAVELRRTGEYSPQKNSTHMRALANQRANASFAPGSNSQNAHRQREHLCCLESDCARVSRVVAELSKDLEKLQSIIRSANQLRSNASHR